MLLSKYGVCDSKSWWIIVSFWLIVSHTESMDVASVFQEAGDANSRA